MRDVQVYLKGLGVRSLIHQAGVLKISKADMVTTSGQPTDIECFNDIRAAVFANFEQDVEVIEIGEEYVFWRI